MEINKKKYVFRFAVFLILAAFLDILWGYLIAQLEYLREYNMLGFKLFYYEFFLNPKDALNALLFAKTGDNSLWQTIHAKYFSLESQLIFFTIFVYASFKILLPDKKFKKQNASDFGSHGSARWATKDEIKKNLLKDKNGFILGEYNGELAVHPKESKLNQIITTFGGSGSGKSAGYSITNTLYNAEEVGESLVITDPKGELYNTTSKHLKENGYNIRVFNLLDMKRSDRYNPMEYIETTEEALSLANMIISNTEGKTPKGDSFWKDAEMAYFASLMMYIKETRPKDEHHIKSVLQFGTRIGQDEDLLNAIFSQLPEDSEALEMYNIFKLAEDKTRANILIGFGVRLKLWVSKNIAQLTRTNDFDLNELGRRKTALFLIIPDSDSTYDLLPGLLIDQLLQELYKQAARNDNLRLNVDVRFILDELANIAAINDFERKVSTMRSRGISVVPIFQSLTQFKNRYDNNRWSEILASSDTIVFLGTNDKDTAKYFSDKIGNTTLLVNSVSQSENQKGSSQSKNHSFMGRALITADELEKLPEDEVIIMQRGRYPVRVKKHFWYKQTQWKNVKKVNWSNDIPEREDPPLSIFNPLLKPEQIYNHEIASTKEKQDESLEFLNEVENETNEENEIITKNNAYIEENYELMYEEEEISIEEELENIETNLKEKQEKGYLKSLFEDDKNKDENGFL